MNEQKQSEFNIVESANKIKKLIEQKQSWEERFEKMTPKYSEINAPSKTKWLGDNPDSHLFYNYTYPESQFELNKEKVKQFISQEIQKASAEADRKAREEERKKMEEEIKITLDDISMVEQDGHPFCFKKTKCEWNEALNEAKREIFKVINK